MLDDGYSHDCLYVIEDLCDRGGRACFEVSESPRSIPKNWVEPEIEKLLYEKWPSISQLSAGLFSK